MCGRYVLAASPELVQKEFNLDSAPKLAPRYNIAPTQPVAIITNDAPKELTIVKWGLIPSWSKDAKIASTLINARSETADSKPSFRSAFKYRRCLIPVTGFYEWLATDDGKIPHFIHVKNQELASFAGLWEVWRNPEGDEVWTCSILTTDANEKIQHLHHRMPVILDEKDRDTWLDKSTDVNELRLLMKIYDSDKIDLYPVSKAVNSVKNDDSSLLVEDQPPKQIGLL
jgi:putative SOS response-associated peptidase YedK